MKKLLASALISLAVVGLSTRQASAGLLLGWLFHGHGCHSYKVKCKPYNAFSPACCEGVSPWGEIRSGWGGHGHDCCALGTGMGGSAFAFGPFVQPGTVTTDSTPQAAPTPAATAPGVATAPGPLTAGPMYPVSVPYPGMMPNPAMMRPAGVPFAYPNAYPAGNFGYGPQFGPQWYGYPGYGSPTPVGAGNAWQPGAPAANAWHSTAGR